MGTIQDKDVAIWVCPEGDPNEVVEFAAGGPPPNVVMCGRHGRGYIKKCPKAECRDRTYHPSDLYDQVHKSCGAPIPWYDAMIGAVDVGPGFYSKLQTVQHQEWETRDGGETQDHEAEQASGALSDDQLFLIRLVWASFNRDPSPTWPDIDVLQLQLDNSGMDHRRVQEIAKTMPQRLLHFDRYSLRGTLRLTVEGLTHCGDTDELIDAAVRFVRLCVDRYREATTVPPTASMTRTEAAGRLALERSSRLLRQLYLVMQEETFVYGGGGESADGDWTFQIRMATIREFLRVDSLMDYRRIVRGLESPTNSEPLAPASSATRTRKTPLDMSTQTASGLRAEERHAVDIRFKNPVTLRQRAARFVTAPIGQGAQDVIRAITVLVVLGVIGWLTGLLRVLGLNLPDPPDLRTLVGK